MPLAWRIARNVAIATLTGSGFAGGRSWVTCWRILRYLAASNFVKRRFRETPRYFFLLIGSFLDRIGRDWKDRMARTKKTATPTRSASEDDAGKNAGPRLRFLMLRIEGGESRNILPYKPEARARGNVRLYPLARASGLYFAAILS
jgi:hypothetical protein